MSKNAEALETLRKVSSGLLDDVVEGNPTKNIHQHLWALSKALSDFMESLDLGKRQRTEVDEDAPTQADPEKYPGGKHAKGAGSTWGDHVDDVPRGRPLQEIIDDQWDFQRRFEELGSRDLTTKKVRTKDELLQYLDAEWFQLLDYLDSHRFEMSRLTEFYDDAREALGEYLEDSGLDVVEKADETHRKYVTSFLNTQVPIRLPGWMRWRWRVEADEQGKVFFQVEHYREDADTMKWSWGRGGKNYPSPHATKTELARMALGALLAYQSHEVFEHFYYQGQRVFGPHISVNALKDVANQLDVRKEQTDQ